MTSPPDLVDKDAIIATLMSRLELSLAENAKQASEIERLAALVAEFEFRLRFGFGCRNCPAAFRSRLFGITDPGLNALA